MALRNVNNIPHRIRVANICLNNFAILWVIYSENKLLTISTIVYYSMKSGNIVLTYWKLFVAFFGRLSSEYETSDSDRKVNLNIYPDAVTCDRCV